MIQKDQAIFEDIDIIGEMKNSQTTPYVFICNAYSAIKHKQFLTARLWIEHADKFRGYFKDSPGEAETFQSIICMAIDFLILTKKRTG
jgi:hypothetical protein